MYESIEEALETLENIIEYVETVNFNDDYHVALEFGYQFRDELVISDD